MLNAQEEAERLWNAVELAAKALPDGCSIDLPILRPEVLGEVARLAKATIDGLLCLDMFGGPVVIEGARWMVNGIHVRAQADARPATPGDVALPVAHTTGPRPTPEAVAAALGVL